MTCIVNGCGRTQPHEIGQCAKVEPGANHDHAAAIEALRPATFETPGFCNGFVHCRELALAIVRGGAS